MLSRLLDLFERSVIVQSLVTLGVIATLIYLWVAQIVVPDDLVQLAMLVVGYWFGSKTQHAIDVAAQKRGR